MNTTLKRLAAVTFALALHASLWLGAPVSHAADHSNLEEGMPVQVEDAYPIAYRGQELQGLFSYDHLRHGQDRFVLDPRLEVGFPLNGQLKLAVPFLLGSADRTGSGDIGFEGFYNFNAESLLIPALALAARADFPTGHNSAGVDTQLKFIATKTLGSSSLLQRLHANVDWTHNAGRMDGERGNRFTGILGYSVRLGPDTMLVTDFVREQEREKYQTANIVELGIRRQLTPLSVLAIGVGTGIGPDSPEARVILAFQHTFGSWFSARSEVTRGR